MTIIILVDPFDPLCDALRSNKPVWKTGMADVIIRALKNGPYEVAGGAKLFDHQGKEHQEDQIDPLLPLPLRSIQK